MDVPDTYISLKENIRLVRGARRGALYDLETGGVWSLNSIAADIIECIDGKTRASEIATLFSSREEDRVMILEFIVALQEKGYLIVDGLPISDPGLVAIEQPKLKVDFLWLEITSRCNLRCLHCYADARTHIPEDELTSEEWKTIIKEAFEIGCRQIQFIGGEPTTRKDFLELLKFSVQYPFDFIEIFSNLNHLDDEMIETIEANKVCVASTLYSCKRETHDAITQVKGSYDRTLSTISRLKEREIKVRVETIAMKQNQHELDGTVEFLKSLGLKSKSPDPVRPSGRGRNLDLIPDSLPEKYSKTMREPDFCVKRDKFVRNMFYNSCWASKVNIASNGDIMPCIMGRDFVVGNIRVVSLREAVEREVMEKAWSLSKDKITICSSCEYRYACHDCRPAASSSASSRYDKPSICTYDPFKGEWMSSQ